MRKLKLRLTVFAATALACALGFGFVQVSVKRQSEAKSNLRYVSLAMIMYCSDFDDVLPYARERETTFAAIYPYTKSPAAFKSLNPGSKILLNPAIAGAAMASIKAPAKVIMFYDQKPWPDGTRLAVFCDAHAMFLSAAEWKVAEKSLHLKLKKKAKPLPSNFYKKIMPGKKLGY